MSIFNFVLISQTLEMKEGVLCFSHDFSKGFMLSQVNFLIVVMLREGPGFSLNSSKCWCKTLVCVYYCRIIVMWLLLPASLLKVGTL